MGPPCVLLGTQRGLHNNAFPRRSGGEWLLYTSLAGSSPRRFTRVFVCVLTPCIHLRWARLSHPLFFLTPTASACFPEFIKLSFSPANMKCPDRRRSSYDALWDSGKCSESTATSTAAFSHNQPCRSPPPTPRT